VMRGYCGKAKAAPGPKKAASRAAKKRPRTGWRGLGYAASVGRERGREIGTKKNRLGGGFTFLQGTVVPKISRPGRRGERKFTD
jgi:hypothetical protein